MKIETREKTKAVSLELSELSDRVYIKDGQSEIWVSTYYDTLTVGVVGGGARYRVVGRELVNAEKKVGVISDGSQ